MLIYVVFAVIVLNPGLTALKVAKRFGKRTSWAESQLSQMERVGLKVCEDEDGRLYPYSRNGRASAWLVQATIKGVAE